VPTRKLNNGVIVPAVDLDIMPPRGHYSAHEVGLLAGVSGTTIGQWARRGYITPSQSDYAPYVYSFQDVGEAILVHELLESGVIHRKIKQAIRSLRDRHGNRWPLQSADVATADGGVVALENDVAWDIGDRIWQRQIRLENLRRIAGLLRRGGWAARGLPDLNHVEVNPNRLSGRPTIRGRRVPVETVARMAEEPGGVQELREGFDLNDAEIDDARRWWREARQYAEAA
jgi:uncharacterized protein (DUF433 family)/DNA-binding transcriptional MerR regulator